MIVLSIYIVFITLHKPVTCEDVCYKDECEHIDIESRYLFYDVNPPEGFNLRRDVYMRMAVLMHNMNKSRDPALNNFKLILPTWSHLVHWSYSETPEYLPWSTFFDVPSLQKFAPVMELHEYFTNLKRNKYTKLLLDRVYVLQHFENMFETGNFEERWKVEKCQRAPKSRYFYYSNITSNNVKCISFHGPATKLSEVFKKTSARTILLEHAEVALHDYFGSKIYWQARRSMRFNINLREIANQFRKTYLNSSDVNDNTYLEPDWLNDKPKRNALGGSYLSIHLRRRDFIRGRPDDTPDLTSVAQQISKHLKNLRLKKVFVATDAPDREFIDLKSKISDKYEVYKYSAPRDIEEKYHEAGIAIIEQIICSYARYFMGTAESTFTFRIQEEREILGFPVDTTFNVLCKEENNCKKPSVWQIVY